MSYSENPYQAPVWGQLASNAEADERAGFIRKTYLHLGGAVLGFIAIEAILLRLPIGADLVNLMMAQRFSWLIVMLAFFGVSVLSERWARSTTSLATQYAGLALYVVAQSIIFLPILLIADRFYPGIIPQAGMVTGVLFGGLTLIVFLTGHDFSYLRTILWFGGLASILLVVWAVISNHTLGIPFSIAMIAFAGGWILYDTSNVMKHYRIGQHVAASLALFASVAILFFYVLRLLMQLNRR
jgi:FtsH-binding integral membrane protein